MSKWEKIGGTAFAAFAALVAVWMVGNCFGLDAESWPAWVQAIGAIAALAVAIWVSADQQRKQELREQRRDADEINGMLLSIRSEWEVILMSLTRQIGPMLENSKPGTPLQFIYPIAEEPFKVYYGLISKLGMIENNELRRQVVHTYGRGQGMVLTFRHHNEIVESYQDAKRRTGLIDDDDDVNSYLNGAASDAFRVLCNYSDSLRTNYIETKVEVLKLLEMLPTD